MILLIEDNHLVSKELMRSLQYSHSENIELTEHLSSSNNNKKNKE